MKAASGFGQRNLLKTVIGLLGLVGSIVLSTEGWTAQIPFSKAKIIFEFNSSGPDLGIQVSLDGEPWNEITIVDPNGRTIFEAEASGRLTNFGLTELFAESNEPNFEDVAPEDILDRFPAGTYKFFGQAVEGERLVGTARLTHAIPDGPSAVSAQVINGAVVISWAAPPPVSSLTGRSVTIVAYQVIVEREDNDSLGAAPRVFDIKLPAAQTSVQVPPQFLEAGEVYKFEVLAIDRGGNQSITEGEPFQMQ